MNKFFCAMLMLYSINTFAANCTVNDSDIADEYSGGCKNGLANGKGVGHGKDKYEGMFKNGNKHGKGTYTWANGDRYEGQWQDDNKHGKGTHTWPSGDRYEGMYANGKKHGHGIYYQHGIFLVQSAGYTEGEWEDGRRVSGNFVAYRDSSSPSSSSSSGNANSYCSTSDTCFETVSTRGDEVTLKCTKGNNTGQTRKIHGPNANGKWAYSLGGYHREFREAGNFACE